MFSIARYFAIADDLETFVCFLDFHEMRKSLRKIQYLVIDLLVTLQPAQSESQNALRSKLFMEGNNKT